MQQFSRVLAAVDFSKPARGAFEYGLALSQRHGAELVVVQAVPPNQELSWHAPQRRTLTAKLRRKADETKVEFMDIVVPYRRRKVAVEPFSHLAVAVDPTRTNRQGTRPSSTRHPSLLTTIRVAIDFSEASLRALAEALVLAQQSGGHLRLLHVLDGFPYETVYSGSRAFRLMQDFRARVARVNRELQSLIPPDALNWVEIDVATVSGLAHESIVSAASARGADLIVLGLPRRSRVKEVVARSAVHRVLRRTTSPVLLVPGPTARLVRPAVEDDLQFATHAGSFGLRTAIEPDGAREGGTP